MPELLIWINDKIISKIIMIHIGDHWIPRQPWGWLASAICKYHRHRRPQEWRLVGQDKFVFYMRHASIQDLLHGSWSNKEKE